MTQVTDPEILRLLNEGGGAPSRTRVTDPALLAQLNARDPESIKGEASRMAMEENGAFKRGLINVGAGFNELGAGIGQLWTDVTGSKAESEAAKRETDDRRARNSALASESFETPYVASALQTIGEVAPTLVVPIGSATMGVRALPKAFNALRGVQAAAPTAARMGTGAFAADAAVTGAGFGAAQAVGTEGSRGENMAKGAAFGAALPLAMGAGRYTHGMVSNSGAERRAVESAAKLLANETGMSLREATEQTLAKLEAAVADRAAAQGVRAPASNIPLSTAASISDPHLARLEAGSRAKNGANWYGFDQEQAGQVYKSVLDATELAAQKGALKAQRGENWRNNWAQAESHLQPATLGKDVAAFRANLDKAMMSPEATNPAVMGMLKQIQSEIDRLGPNFTAGHLQQIRANLSGSQKFMPQNAFEAAPRDSFATRSVLQEVDNILNKATGNRWNDVRGGYSDDSKLLHAAVAAQKVRGKFIDQDTGRVLGTAADVAGQVPRITEFGLGGAMNAARQKGSLALLPQDEQALAATLAALRKQNIVQGVKRSATAGGGSNTASDQFAAHAADAAASSLGGPAGAVASAGSRKAWNYIGNNRDEAMSRLLQDPAKMAEVLRAKIASGQPLTLKEEGLLQVLRGGATSAAQN